MNSCFICNASAMALAAFRDKRFVVQLNHDLGESQAVEVLCHEWAHALAWNFSLDRLAKTPGINPVEFDRACHDEA
jgi:hypothetical protein